jgi:hypothetical protein
MTDEVLRDRERSGGDAVTSPGAIQADPTQVLTGWPVGLPTGLVICVSCGAQLGEGRAVTVYGYRVAERSEWDLRRCYCVDCAPQLIRSPTLGVSELLAEAWLGTLAISRDRTHHLCLTEVDCVAFSPPSEGADP